MCIIVQNFVLIGQAVVEIWLSFDFSKWWPSCGYVICVFGPLWHTILGGLKCWLFAILCQ